MRIYQVQADTVRQICPIQFQVTMTEPDSRLQIGSRCGKGLLMNGK